MTKQQVLQLFITSTQEDLLAHISERPLTNRAQQSHGYTDTNRQWQVLCRVLHLCKRLLVLVGQVEVID